MQINESRFKNFKLARVVIFSIVLAIIGIGAIILSIFMLLNAVPNENGEINLTGWIILFVVGIILVFVAIISVILSVIILKNRAKTLRLSQEKDEQDD